MPTPPYHPRFRKLFLPLFCFSAVILVVATTTVLSVPLSRELSHLLFESRSDLSADTTAIIALTAASFAFLIFAPLLAFVYWPEVERKPRREASLPLE